MTAVATSCAKAVDDIEAWELFPGTHIVGSRALDRYATVPSKSVPVMLEAVRAMNCENDLDEIALKMRASGYLLDMHQLHGKLWKAGLLEGAPYQGDVTRFSNCWFSMPVTRLFQWVPRSERFLGLTAALCLVVIVLALSLALFREVNPASYLALRDVTGIFAAFCAFIAAVLISVASHEGAHGLAGAAFGCPPSRLRGLGYFGFIPAFVLTIPGIYTLTPRKRIAVWLAGPAGSLTAAAVAVVLDQASSLGVSAHVRFEQFAAVNIGIAVYNLCPLLPTDGYFVLSTILRKPNMKSRAWREMADFFRGVRRPNKPLVIYGLILAAFPAVVIARNIHMLLAFTAYSFVGYLAVALIGLALCMKLFRSAETGRK